MVDVNTETVTAGELQDGDVIVHSGVEYTTTVRQCGNGLVVVSGLTEDNRGWFRFLLPAVREFERRVVR